MFASSSQRSERLSVLDEPAHDPIAAMALGPVLTLPTEVPGLVMRAIDFDMTVDANVAEITDRLLRKLPLWTGKALSLGARDGAGCAGSSGSRFRQPTPPSCPSSRTVYT